MRRPPRFSLALLVLGALLATACAEITDDQLAAINNAAYETTDDAVRELPTPQATDRPFTSGDGAETTTPAGREGSPPEIQRIRCPFEREDLADVNCGKIRLPGRGANDRYTVDLAFARFYATGDAEEVQPDPVVFLHGGPGGAILDDIDFWYESIVAPHIASRDVIVYDQRGGGRSTSLPKCHEVTEVGDRFHLDDAPHESMAAEFIDGLANCAKKFRELTTIDITAFNSSANAQDLVDLMWALGIRQYNIHGSSYGTRLAQTVMRDAPEGVRSVVLSGIYPIEENLMGSIALSMESSLTAVFAGCAADGVCNRALPQPWSVLEELVAELDADPMKIDIATTYAETLTITFDGTDLLNGLHSLLYVGYDAASVPDMLIDHVDGDDRRIRRLGGQSLFDVTDTATFLIVQCADERPFTSAADLLQPLDHEFLRAVDLAPAINGIDSLTICESWDTGITDPIENEPVTWDVPTLLLAGAVDPITPPTWAADLASRLPRSRLVIQAELSHDSDEGWCALGLLGDFIRQPEVLLDTSCAAASGDLTVDNAANRLRADRELIDVSLDLDGDGDYAEIRLPDWYADWQDDVHIRWRGLDAIDPTALIILDGDSEYELVDHLTFAGIVPEWVEDPQRDVPAGWTRWTMRTTGGDLISYVRDTDDFEIALLLEVGEAENLELEILLPAAISSGVGS